MKLYKDIKRISDFPLMTTSSISMDEMFVLLAYLRNNYIVPLSQLKQKRIVSITQDARKIDGLEIPISVNFEDGSKFLINIKNGSTGDIGNKGITGPEGDKGDSAEIDNALAESKGVKSWLYIANDGDTDDSNKAFSAQKGVEIAKALELLTETFLSESQYNLLYGGNDELIFIEAEFETTSENQVIKLINFDKSKHIRYQKYWTFESEGDQEYFIFNPVSQTYDSYYCELWKDILLGGREGFFEASSVQLTDGTQLYIKNLLTGEYEPINQFNDVIYVSGTLEDGTPGYVIGDINNESFDTFYKFVPEHYEKIDKDKILSGQEVYVLLYGKEYKNVTATYQEVEEQLYIKKDAEYKKVSEEYITTNRGKIYGERKFKYALLKTKTFVNVEYQQSEGYTVTFDGKPLELNIYLLTVEQDKEGKSVIKYIKVKREDVDPYSSNQYFKYEDGQYIQIENVADYIKEIYPKYFIKNVAGEWTEVSELTDKQLDNYTEYVTFNINQDNKNAYDIIRYSPVVTHKETYYVLSKDIINPSSIIYYIEDNNRQYFTRTIDSVEDEEGNVEFVYRYHLMSIPVWVEAEFITYDEDQNIRLLNADTHYLDDIEKIEPVYIEELEFEDNNIVIAKNFNKDIKLNIYPVNANQIDLVIDYDNELINLFEDGRIAAINQKESDITTETSIKVSSEKNPYISDTVNIKIVTPIEKIKFDSERLNIYPGNTVKLVHHIEPEVVSDSRVNYSTSDNEMIVIDENGNITPRLINGEYKTGRCTITLTANDGFGAKSNIEVLVAIPATSLRITSNNFGFIGVPFEIKTEVMPSNVTDKTFIYESSNPDVLEIDAFGNIKPKARGKSTVTVKTTDGSNLTATQEISVTKGVESIEITGLDDSIEVGLYNDVDIRVLPYDADNNKITFRCSDPSLVEISELKVKDEDSNLYTTRVNVLKSGHPQFIAEALDGTQTIATQEVNLTVPMDKIGLDITDITIYTTTERLVLNTIINPDVTNKQVTWTSSNTLIVNVDQRGIVTPVGPGKAIVSVISNDANGVVASCNIEVKRPIESIELNYGNYDDLTVLVNNYTFVNAMVTPDDATDQILLWSSSDESTVTVDENGVIYGVKTGEAIITVTSKDAIDKPASQTIKVTVIEKTENNTQG